MGDWNTFLDNQTVSVSGGTVTSSGWNVDNQQTLSLQSIAEDSNATNVDIELQGKVRGGSADPWATVNVESGVDLTSFSNNSKIDHFDVADEEEVRVVYTNNGGTQTSLSSQGNRS